MPPCCYWNNLKYVKSASNIHRILEELHALVLALKQSDHGPSAKKKRP